MPEITEECVLKLLLKTILFKATGPGGITTRVRKACAHLTTAHHHLQEVAGRGMCAR